MVCLQDCVVLSVLVAQHHTIWLWQSPLISELIWICPVAASCGRPGLRYVVCPTGSLFHPRQHKELDLVFFSPFEPITLTPNAVCTTMQRNRVPMFYDTASSSNLPSLYICLARNVLGRVPLTSSFVQGNRTLTCPTALVPARDSEQWLAAGMGLASLSRWRRQQLPARFMSSTLGFGIRAGISHARFINKPR